MTPKKKTRGSGTTPGGRPRGGTPPNLLVLARFDQKSARVIAIQAAGGPPAKGKLRPVLLNDSTCQDYSIGTTEIIVAFHRRDGSHLASWGQTGRAKVFVDVEGQDPKGAHRIQGGLIAPPRDERLLHVPVPDNATYLAFYRSEVVPFVPPVVPELGAKRDDRRGKGKHDLRVTLLGVYWLPWDEDPQPPDGDLELPGIELQPYEIRIVGIILEKLPKPGWKPIYVVVPGGDIVGYDIVHGNGEIDTNFNVVILGDGFSTDADQQEFARRCGLVKTALEGTPPFSDYFDRTNVFAVNTRSIDSGITDCPLSMQPRNTYYRVRGFFDGSDYVGYLGSDVATFIYDAAEHFAALDRLDVLLVISNCEHKGGSAFVHKQIAYVALCDSDRQFTNIALHEMAHEIGHLGEEYIPQKECPYDEVDRFLNVVRREEMHAAPWRRVARSDEINQSNERFSVIRDCTLTSCDHSHNCLSPYGYNPFPKLGLYWGAQYRDESIDTSRFDPSPCPAHSTALGKDYFRAMATCKMRHYDWDFCRWCKKLLSEAIEKA
ncbi:MAG: M64 family metallopeptidase, partial [Candidatus Latescibacterota bacterium]